MTSEMNNKAAAPQQPNPSVVAAVYDRRGEDSPDAHRAPLQGKPRLRRLDRVYGAAPIYFLTACILNRRLILASEPLHQAFRTFCQNSPEYGAWIGSYVLMPDHLHLFVALDGISISAWVKSMKNALSKTLRATGEQGPHWQKGFFDHLLRSGESYSEKWDYVRQNPVRAGLVKTPEDWLYAGKIHDLDYRK